MCSQSATSTVTIRNHRSTSIPVYGRNAQIPVIPRRRGEWVKSTDSASAIGLGPFLRLNHSRINRAARAGFVLTCLTPGGPPWRQFRSQISSTTAGSRERTRMLVVAASRAAQRCNRSWHRRAQAAAILRCVRRNQSESAMSAGGPYEAGQTVRKPGTRRDSGDARVLPRCSRRGW